MVAGPWCRRPAAMLVTPFRRSTVMARLRRNAMTWGPLAGADAVFVVGDVADVVEAVFDGPVATAITELLLIGLPQ